MEKANKYLPGLPIRWYYYAEPFNEKQSPSVSFQRIFWFKIAKTSFYLNSNLFYQLLNRHTWNFQMASYDVWHIHAYKPNVILKVKIRFQRKFHILMIAMKALHMYLLHWRSFFALFANNLRNWHSLRVFKDVHYATFSVNIYRP